MTTCVHLVTEEDKDIFILATITKGRTRDIDHVRLHQRSK